MTLPNPVLPSPYPICIACCVERSELIPSDISRYMTCARHQLVAPTPLPEAEQRRITELKAIIVDEMDRLAAACIQHDAYNRVFKGLTYDIILEMAALVMQAVHILTQGASAEQQMIWCQQAELSIWVTSWLKTPPLTRESEVLNYLAGQHSYEGAA